MRITGLSFSYDRASAIFSQFDFESNAKYLFLQGASGCGKSTLLKLITENLNPQYGSISFENSRGSKKCLILQEDALFPWLTGTQNITCVLNDIERPTIESNPMYAYVKDFIDKKACNMSFGQRRLIELFRAILYNPNLLCLDEPFNYLDQQSRRTISEIIFSGMFLENTEQVIMTTHYDSDISDISNTNYSRYYFNGAMPYAKLEKK